MSTDQSTFPPSRPEIRIEASREAPFRIDLREMAWWFIVPETGDRVAYGSYASGHGEAPWMLTETVSLEACRPAVIHGRACVEIEVEEHHLAATTGDHTATDQQTRIVKIWGRLAEDAVEWMAVESLRADGTRELMTFLDEGFHDDWGPSPRRIEDRGCLRPLADGSFAVEADVPQLTGAGVFDVHIGDRSFACMRVFDLEKEAGDRGVMVEAYVTRSGRTVLFRRYSGNRWGKRDAPPHNWGEEMTWEEDLPHNHRMVIGGVTYVHHYDNLADAAFVSK